MDIAWHSYQGFSFGMFWLRELVANRFDKLLVIGCHFMLLESISTQPTVGTVAAHDHLR